MRLSHRRWLSNLSMLAAALLILCAGVFLFAPRGSHRWFNFVTGDVRDDYTVLGIVVKRTYSKSTLSPLLSGSSLSAAGHWHCVGGSTTYWLVISSREQMVWEQTFYGDWRTMGWTFDSYDLPQPLRRKLARDLRDIWLHDEQSDGQPRGAPGYIKSVEWALEKSNRDEASALIMAHVARKVTKHDGTLTSTIFDLRGKVLDEYTIKSDDGQPDTSDTAKEPTK